MPSREQRATAARECQYRNGQFRQFSQSTSAIKQQTMLKGFYNDQRENWYDKVYIGGMCHTMSLYWLALRSRGEDFLDWIRPHGRWDEGRINALVIKTGMYKNNQNKFVPNYKGFQKDFDNDFFAFYGLRPYGAALTANGFHDLCVYVGQTEGYHMMSLAGSKHEDADAGAHAVAARVAGGEAAFFDPNYGEFAFQNAKVLAGFLTEFFDFSDYIFTYNGTRSIRTFRPDRR